MFFHLVSNRPWHPDRNSECRIAFAIGYHRRHYIFGFAISAPIFRCVIVSPVSKSRKTAQLLAIKNRIQTTAPDFSTQKLANLFFLEKNKSYFYRIFLQIKIPNFSLKTNAEKAKTFPNKITCTSTGLAIK
jgi:hypothetical protein